jgi:hypothetical protein
MSDEDFISEVRYQDAQIDYHEAKTAGVIAGNDDVTISVDAKDGGKAIIKITRDGTVTRSN